MTESNARRRLIIVCGLPGAGKTTLAKSLEESLRAIRFSADEWMEALSLDLYDEEGAERSRRCNGLLARNS